MRTPRFFLLEEPADDERLILIKIPIATIKTIGITTDIIIIISFFGESPPLSSPNVVALVAIKVDAVVDVEETIVKVGLIGAVVVVVEFSRDCCVEK